MRELESVKKLRKWAYDNLSDFDGRATKLELYQIANEIEIEVAEHYAELPVDTGKLLKVLGKRREDMTVTINFNDGDA